MPTDFLHDGEDGDIYFHSSVVDSLKSAEVIAEDTRLDDELNDHWLPEKAAATAAKVAAQAANNDEDEAVADARIAIADERIAAIAAKRTDLATVLNNIGEVTSDRGL